MDHIEKEKLAVAYQKAKEAGDLSAMRQAAKLGDVKGQYELGNMYKFGSMYEFEKSDKTIQLARFLHSQKMRDLEFAHKATPEQERALLFCAVLMTRNWESSRIFPMMCNQEDAAKVIRDFWDINNRQDVIAVLDYLSIADRHTKRINQSYEAIVYNANLIRSNGGNDILAELENFNNIGYGKDNFIHAARMLISFGYCIEELLALPTLAAWDYGRCGFIARFSATAGYIDINTAWDYIMGCAQNATTSQVTAPASGIVIRTSAPHYDSWRQYLAAYTLGRALWGGRSNCADLEYVLAYLLFDPLSPFNQGIGIKPNQKETSFNFCKDRHFEIKIDPKEAVYWWMQAAEQGLAEAQYCLAAAYQNGDGIEKDWKCALQWYNKAARQGHKKSQVIIEKEVINRLTNTSSFSNSEM